MTTRHEAIENYAQAVAEAWESGICNDMFTSEQDAKAWARDIMTHESIYQIQLATEMVQERMQ